MEAMKKMLAKVVGGENVTDEREVLSSFLGAPADQARLAVCFPASTDEVQAIIRLAGQEGCPVFTTTDTRLPGDMNGRKGIILNFRRMQGIERIDAKNLSVHIDRGVTYSRLAQAIKPLGLKYLAPAAATSESVVENAVNRAIMIQAVRYPDLQASNFRVVLADGQLQRTGSHALGEEIADWKEDGGPYLSKWYYGSGDMYGIVTHGTIWIYPYQERHVVKACGFGDRDQALEVMKSLSRREILNEAIVVNRTEAQKLFPPLSGEPLPWYLIYGFESFSKHVGYLEGIADTYILNAGGRLLDVPSEELLACVESPWFVGEDRWLGFYALYTRVPEIMSALSGILRERGIDSGSLPFRYVSFGSGRAVYCHVTLPMDDHGGIPEEVYAGLLDARAFFDRPLGPAARAVYQRSEAYLYHLKRLKRILDPGYILNPGQPVDLSLPKG